MSDMALRPRHYLRTNLDKLALASFIIGWFVNLAYETFVVAHYFWKGMPMSYGFPVVMLLLTIQILWNLYYVIIVDNRPSVFSTGKAGKDKATKTSCEKCKADMAANAVHCDRCDGCILAKDFHCCFVGNCIGGKNQSYFLVLVCYLWLAAYIENIYNLQLVCDFLGCNMMSLMAVCMPHFPILQRSLHPVPILINTMTFIGVLCLILLSFLLYKQLSQLFTGNSSQEKKTLTPTLIFHNTQKVLGQRWYLAFICPVFTAHFKQHQE